MSRWARSAPRRRFSRFSRRGLVVLGCGFALAPGVAGASGFHIDEQDARATGRGGAVIASTSNASAIYYNPAGIADLNGVNLVLGGVLVRPDGEFTSAADGSVTGVNTSNVIVPQAFASWRLGEVVALGIGAYAPFGLALDWPASSPGRTNIRKADLRTFFISPTIGFNLSRWLPGLSLGAGIDFVPAGVRLDRDILFGTDVAKVALDGSAFGVGGRVGVLYRPPSLSAFAFGLSYRTPVSLDFSGDADFDAPPTYRSSLPPDGGAKTSFTLPQSVNGGVVVSPVPELQLEVDLNWSGWATYDELDIELPGGSVDRQRKDWKDSFTLRFGGEYTFDQRWSVRAGVIWDQTPVPADTLDFQVPDVDRVDLSLGFGAKLIDRVRVDLGALYVLPQKRQTSMNEPLEPAIKGQFDVNVLVFALSVGVELETVSHRADAGLDAARVEPCGLLRGSAVDARLGTCPE